jgi:tetratricopeptide (TPR) repeat protein
VVGVNEAERWSVAHLEGLHSDERHLPIRRHFGIRAFGINAWRGAEQGDEVIDDHDELIEGHEELYLVLRGRASFAVDGEEIDAPAGTLLYVTPAVRRRALAREANTVVLAIGGKPGHAFSPSGWEEWGALRIPDLLDEGRDIEAASRYRSALEIHPNHPGVLYNLACLLSRAGDRDEALDYLRRSIELRPGNREHAQNDADLEPLRSDPRFTAIVGAS